MRALVTGAGGFLGKALARRLVERGDEVLSFSRGTHRELERLGVRHVTGDLGNEVDIRTAMKDCDVVFHVAAKADPWGRYEEYFQTNVIGTRNVVEGCKAMRVPRLVYTSSPCVVFNGRSLNGVDESAPYGVRSTSGYQTTKTMAERLVLASNCDTLSTVALRPHLIWGPGDNHLIPRIVARARKGQLRIVGTGTNIVDHVFVDNAAQAHVQAAVRLAPGCAVAGKAYFISNGEPRAIEVLINGFLAVYDLPPVRRHVAAELGYLGGWLLEKFYRALGLKGEPLVTRFLARELSTAHWFNISAARRDFGYEPAISLEEGLELLRASLAQPAVQRPLRQERSLARFLRRGRMD